MLDIPKRLLSYYFIQQKQMVNDKVFLTIVKEDRNENQQSRASERPRKSQAGISEIK